MLYCAESDSEQYNTVQSQTPRQYKTAWSQEIEMSENPKLPNTVRSQQLKFTADQKCLSLHKVQHCAEFCQGHFCLCRPLLALIENLKFFRKYI